MSQMQLADLNVLVVEPSTTQRHIITRALNNAGIGTALECMDGSSALSLLQSEKPDLIISSMYLPDMTGTDLVHNIRESKVQSDTAFMLISSETRFRYLDPIRQAGTVGILPKPFTQEELLAGLNSSLDLVAPDYDEQFNFESESLHVLVVDDSRLARKHITRVLGSLGINQVTHAEDGLQALEMIDLHYFDFIVTDYNMPHMDGKELVDRIRKESSQSSIPILMVTSEENENRLAAVQQSGISAICDKPFEPTTIKQLISSFIDR